MKTVLSILLMIGNLILLSQVGDSPVEKFLVLCVVFGSFIIVYLWKRADDDR